MNDDNQPAATGADQSRHVATDPDYEYSLSIDDSADRYARAGHPRTPRSLQRYCATGHLDCRRVATPLGDKFFVAPYSVSRHIAQINEQVAFVQRTTGRDLSRHDATTVAPQNMGDTLRQDTATSTDLSRPVATEPVQKTEKREEVARDTTRADEIMSRYVERLEGENSFLRDQMTKKDEQIDDLSQRFKETQGLLGVVQRMMAPLLGQADPFKRSADSDTRDVEIEK
jgi:hypothetical protein